MQIYLAKPGSNERLGPFSLDQINQDLAAKKYRDDDYWAWHDGLPQWVPLHAVPGVSAAQAKPSAVPSSTISATSAPAPAVPAPVPAPSMVPATVAAAAAPVPSQAAQSVSSVPQAASTQRSATSSGQPFEALEQVILFTTGEGPTVWDSAAVVKALQEATGQVLGEIRNKVKVDVVGRAAISAQEIRESSLPDKVLRALKVINPGVARGAQEGLYHLFVRSFLADNNDVVVLLLFYDKAKAAA